MRRATLWAVALIVAVVAAPAALGSNYVVLYKQQAVPADSTSAIQRAGGSVVATYPQIGVVIASSDSASFRGALLKDARVENASATAGFATQLPPSEAGASSSTDTVITGPVSDTDSLSGLQWDMTQIHTPEAHAITGGSSSVLVGDIDTGLDFTHPDLAPNVDSANSANCLSGAPVPGAVAANDDNGHGTHTAGTIAAAANGIGIVGVAPNVHIAGIKAGNAAGFFFPEAVVCAFVWAGSHGFDVTNNSYFADPYYFNCRNDAAQRAIWLAESRAIRYAQTQGVSVVAALGNFSDDLAHPTQDTQSPDDTTPVTRDVNNGCVVIPTEVPGVIGVSSDGNARQDGGGFLKSFYSNYGLGVADVVAPGGDSLFGRTAAAVNGRVLSTYPAALMGTCARKVIDVSGATYCYLQGTSMASPHAAGVAALVASVYGRLSPGAVAAFVQGTADAQPCPSSLPTGYDAFVSVANAAPQVCTGAAAMNSWYGHGQVNALRAITNAR
jgi:lantibiotic leader peptide-processing serine protease